jgi:hypothetical protein
MKYRLERICRYDDQQGRTLQHWNTDNYQILEGETDTKRSMLE